MNAMFFPETTSKIETLIFCIVSLYIANHAKLYHITFFNKRTLYSVIPVLYVLQHEKKKLYRNGKSCFTVHRRLKQGR